MLVTDPLPQDIFRSKLPSKNFDVQFGRPNADFDQPEVYDIWVTRHAFKISRATLELGKSRGLGWIIQAASGVDNIDLLAAKQLKIVVDSLPGFNAITASEHALTLLLAARKQLIRRHHQLQSGAWNRAPLPCEVAGLRLGVLGLGFVGTRMAAMAVGLGMNVVAYDPAYPPSTPWKKLHAWKSLPANQQFLLKSVVRVGRPDALLRRAEVLSLHFPAAGKNSKWLSSKRIELLPTGAIVINCARGEIVDSNALISALRTGHLSALGLDVFDPEPPSRQSPFFTEPGVQEKVVTTAHVGGASIEAQERLALAAVARVRAIWRGAKS